MLSLIDILQEEITEGMVSKHARDRFEVRLKPEYRLVYRLNNREAESDQIGTYTLNRTENQLILDRYDEVVSHKYDPTVNFAVKIYDFAPVRHIQNGSSVTFIYDYENIDTLLDTVYQGTYGIYISGYNPESEEKPYDSADGIYLVIKGGRLATFLFHRQRHVRYSLKNQGVEILYYAISDVKKHII